MLLLSRYSDTTEVNLRDWGSVILNCPQNWWDNQRGWGFVNTKQDLDCLSWYIGILPIYCTTNTL